MTVEFTLGDYIVTAPASYFGATMEDALMELELAIEDDEEYLEEILEIALEGWLGFSVLNWSGLLSRVEPIL